MKEFIIGREGNQCFDIKNDNVSRTHAKITIGDDGRWMLEDLGSHNGTFIQNEKGDFVQVNKVEINEYTRIALGSPIPVLGYFFYAHHVLEEDDNYEAEMQYVMQMHKKLCKEKESKEDSNKLQAIFIRYLPSIASALIFLITTVLNNPELSWLQRLSGAATATLGTIATLLQAKSASKLKDLSMRQTKLIRCPRCNAVLSSQDIEHGVCLRCINKI